MDSLRMSLTFDVPASRVYQAIASRDGPAGWWTRFCEVSEEPGGHCELRFPAAGFFARMKNIALDKERLIEWECIHSRHPQDSGRSDLRDWVGTFVRFAIESEGSSRCRLEFEHVGLTPRLECFEACESAWAFYLNESLRGYLERGAGQPYADDSENRI